MAVTIKTYSRRNVDLENPKPSSLRRRDIAHALANINRFTGHTPVPYSVAEHCLIGSYVVTGEYALEFLLHDASEAYLGDVSAPLKSLLGASYSTLEAKFERAIVYKFGLHDMPGVWLEVKRVDRLLLACEMDVFMGRRMDVCAMQKAGPDALRIFDRLDELRIVDRLRRREPIDFERAFLLRWAELDRQRGAC